MERLWGEKTDVRFEIRLVNTPFFTPGVAVGDLVRVRADHERRELVYVGFTAESGHSTVRIVFLRSEVRDSVERRLRELGCSWEITERFQKLMAVDVPPDVSYGDLRPWLLQRIESGDIEIQESAISAVHRGQLSKFP